MGRAFKAEIEAEIIGRNLKILRKNASLTQSAVASILGISFQQMQKYEKGKNRLPIEYLYTLQKFYDVPYEIFFAGLGDQAISHHHVKNARLSIDEKINQIKNPHHRERIIQAIYILCG
jgi:transcriptional regulator with XRE-family HTH domain